MVKGKATGLFIGVPAASIVMIGDVGLPATAARPPKVDARPAGVIGGGDPSVESDEAESERWRP